MMQTQKIGLLAALTQQIDNKGCTTKFDYGCNLSAGMTMLTNGFCPASTDLFCNRESGKEAEIT